MGSPAPRLLADVASALPSFEQFLLPQYYTALAAWLKGDGVSVGLHSCWFLGNLHAGGCPGQVQRWEEMKAWPLHPAPPLLEWEWTPGGV